MEKMIKIGDREVCPKLQWGKLFTINGELACPNCHKPAELIIGFMGNPCYGHKIEREEVA